MRKDIKEIIESLKSNEKKYFVDDDGYIMERINPAYNEKTGYYINDNGEYVRETDALSFDQKTGVYEDEKGDIREEAIFFDDKTGYYKDKDKYKKEGFFGRNYEERASNENRNSSSSVPQDEVSTIFFFVKWGIIIAIALFVLMVAVFLAPLGLLIWYLVAKREKQWIAILGILFAAYLIYDILTGGFLTTGPMNFQRDGSEKFIALGYFTLLVTTLGFLIDKYSSTKIPVVENGNFFQQKNIKERRPLIAGFSFLLLIVFSIFQFVSFSDNSSNTNNSYENEIQTTNPSETTVISNKTDEQLQEEIINEITVETGDSYFLLKETYTKYDKNFIKVDYVGRDGSNTNPKLRTFLIDETFYKEDYCGSFGKSTRFENFENIKTFEKSRIAYIQVVNGVVKCIEVIDNAG